MSTKSTHKKYLRRAKARRVQGLPSHRIEQETRLERAWRNIFVKAGILKS